MGKVEISIEVSNNKDIFKAEEAYHSESWYSGYFFVKRFSRYWSNNAFLTKKKYIELLGLPLSKEVVVSTATGQYITNVYNNALLKIQNRSALVEIIELHDDSTPLLGVISMEILGLEVDVIKHELQMLPDHSKDTYLMAYWMVFLRKRYDADQAYCQTFCTRKELKKRRDPKDFHNRIPLN